jgi:D-aminoacyl-tRNA deacylase
MRAVVQRVSEANVMIDEKKHREIQLGFLVLLGIEINDTIEDVKWLSAKIAQLRIMNDAGGQMNLGLHDVGGDILLISQFTLHASTKKGNRPSFLQAARPEIAIPLYEKMIEQLEIDLGRNIKTGIFGADMKVHLINDGPVTIIFDTKNKQ